jgi:hypothetical protein
MRCLQSLQRLYQHPRQSRGRSRSLGVQHWPVIGRTRSVLEPVSPTYPTQLEIPSVPLNFSTLRSFYCSLSKYLGLFDNVNLRMGNNGGELHVRCHASTSLGRHNGGPSAWELECHGSLRFHHHLLFQIVRSPS